MQRLMTLMTIAKKRVKLCKRTANEVQFDIQTSTLLGLEVDSAQI